MAATKSTAALIPAIVFATMLLQCTGEARSDDPGLYPVVKERLHSNIYRSGTVVPSRPESPIRLKPGPHLFVDDYLIESSNNVRRRVNRPQRDSQIPNPLITGKEDHCVAPYMSVIRDPSSGRFRIWYNIYKKLHTDGSARFATMESEDGIHWIRPHRVLDDPGPINFGCSVLDEGPDFSDPSARYKLAWWANGGLMIATSSNGINWRPLQSDPVLRHNHDINNLFRDTIRDRYVATVSCYTTGPNWSGKRRCTMQSASRDLIHWEEPRYILTPDDSVEKGETQFYAMQGHLIRGGLWIGLVKVLHDDWPAPGTPEGAYGVGYTTLAWTRDGKNWVRDLEPFFEPDPQVGAWDHAHAWMDYQLPLGDDVYIYYGGYKNGHKVNRWEERQIGLVRMKRDRYVAREAGPKEGRMKTPPIVLDGSRMTLNAEAKGAIHVRLLDPSDATIEGFDWDDCEAVHGDAVSHPIQWKGGRPLPKNTPVQVEFRLKNARLYAFDIVK